MKYKLFSVVATVVGIVFLAAGIASFFYYQTSSVSEHYQWTLITYPYRQFAVVFFAVGLALLVAGALVPERRVGRQTGKPDDEPKKQQEENPEKTTETARAEGFSKV